MKAKKSNLTPQEIFVKATSGKSITPEEREVLRKTLSTPFYPEGLTGNEKLKDKKENKARVGTKLNNSLGGYIPNVVKQTDIPKAKSGIYIKPENKGKFTASAKAAGRTVQEHARAVLNDPNATPLQKKRANFARNAAKWKHQDGGRLQDGGKLQDGGNIISADSVLSYSNSNKEEFAKGGYLPRYKTRNGKQPEIPKRKYKVPTGRLMQYGGYSWGTGGYEAPTAKIQNTNPSSVKITNPSYNIKDKLNLETEARSTINDLYSDPNYKRKIVNEYIESVFDNPNYKNILSVDDLYNSRINNLKEVKINWDNTTGKDKGFSLTLGEYHPGFHTINLNKDLTAKNKYSFNTEKFGKNFDKDAYQDYINFLYNNPTPDNENQLKQMIRLSPAYNTLLEEFGHSTHYGDFDTYKYDKYSVPSKSFNIFNRNPYDELKKAYSFDYINYDKDNPYWTDEDFKKSGRLYEITNTRITPSALKTMSKNLKSKDNYKTHPSEFIAKKTTAEAFLINTGQMKLGENFTDKSIDYLLNNYWDLPPNVQDFIDAFTDDKIDRILKDENKTKDLKERIKEVGEKIAINNSNQPTNYAQKGGRVISADSVIEYNNGSKEYNNKGYIPNAQSGKYINNYQQRLNNYIQQGLNPQYNQTYYDQYRGPLDYGFDKSFKNFNTKAGINMDIMTNKPNLYGELGVNHKGFNANFGHKRGFSGKSTNVDLNYFGDKFSGGLSYSNNPFEGKRKGFNMGYSSPNIDVDMSYFNTSNGPEINSNLGFRKGRFNTGVGYNYGFGQHNFEGRVGYSGDNYSINAHGSLSPDNKEINANLIYELGKRKQQKQEPIELSEEVIRDLEVLSGKRPLETDESDYPTLETKESKFKKGGLICRKCGGYHSMKYGGKSCSCKHK